MTMLRRIKSLLGIFLVATTGLAMHAAAPTKYKNIVEYKKLAPQYAKNFVNSSGTTSITHYATPNLTFFHVNDAALAKDIADNVKAAHKLVKKDTSLEPAFKLLIDAIFYDAQMPKALSSKHPKEAQKLVKYINKAKASGTTKGGSTQTEADAKAALQNLADKLESTIGYTHKALEHTINFLSSFATNGADVNGQVPSRDPNQPWTITPQAKIDAMKNVANSANLGTLKSDAHTLSTALQTTAAKLDGNANETTIKAIIANATTGQLHQDVLAFIAAFNKAAAGSKKVAKTPAELQKHYKNLLEAAVPAAYNFSTTTNLGGNSLHVPANNDSWFTIKDNTKTKLSGTAGTALISVKDAQAAYKEVLVLINAINKVDAVGVMQKADDSVITDKDIIDAITRAKKAVADAQTAVDGAFEAIGGGPTEAHLNGNNLVVLDGSNNVLPLTDATLVSAGNAGASFNADSAASIDDNPKTSTLFSQLKGANGKLATTIATELEADQFVASWDKVKKATPLETIINALGVYPQPSYVELLFKALGKI